MCDHQTAQILLSLSLSLSYLHIIRSNLYLFNLFSKTKAPVPLKAPRLFLAPCLRLRREAAMGREGGPDI